MRTCTKCKVEKQISDFYKDSAQKKGFCSYCKKCKTDYDNTEKRKAHKKKYQSSERVVEMRRGYYYKSKGLISERRLKLRFEIFRRDAFTCQYCGRKAPDVILHIDHIYPKSKGGLNNAGNYNTACIECNLGKGDSLL